MSSNVNLCGAPGHPSRASGSHAQGKMSIFRPKRGVHVSPTPVGPGAHASPLLEGAMKRTGLLKSDARSHFRNGEGINRQQVDRDVTTQLVLEKWTGVSPGAYRRGADVD